MKILFVISSMGIGGEQRASSIITNYLVENGHEIDLYCFKNNSKSISFNNKITINEINSDNKFRNLERISEIRKAYKQEKYDVVIAFGLIPTVLVPIALLGYNIPIIICERNDPKVYPTHWKLIRRIAYKFVPAAVFQTEEALNYFGNNFFNKSKIIHNPIDVKKIPERDKNTVKTIVNTSRLTKPKNHKMLIKAFANIVKTHKNYKLLIYGEGPLRDELNELIIAKGLQKKVIISEPSDNILNKIKNSEIFVLSSNHEGFPNSLAEALAIGIPSISTNCRIGGPKEMITNNENGILVEPDNVKQMEKALRKLLEDKHLRMKFSNNSIKIKEQLDSNTIGKKWEDFIYDVVFD